MHLGVISPVSCDSHVTCICYCVTHSDYGYKHADGFSSVCVRDEDVTLSATCQDGDISFVQSLG